MNRIVQIRRIFKELDGFLSKQESNARTLARKLFWKNKRAINGQAYFIIIFAQLEDYINARCRRLVAKKQSQSNWKRKRLWERIRIERIDQMPFMDRVALLTKRGDADYNEIRALYEIRCILAHGGTHPINVGDQAETMQKVGRRLKG